MADRLYNLIRRVGSRYAYTCTGLEHIEHGGPAIYAANHLRSEGPIQVILSIPLRLYPWAIGEMADPKRAPQYLYDDFVHPDLHLSGRFGMAFSAVLSRLATAVLRGVGCIFVDRNAGNVFTPFRPSLALLLQGKNLLVFPEDRKLPIDPVTGVHEFLVGYCLLTCTYERETGQRLPVHPVAVRAGARTIAIGAPRFFEPQGNHRQDIRRFGAQIYRDVCALYQGVES